ncbi:MAG TPA: T9SS type A sorting domain-containing protein [Bacteroidia bacterium]|jgi:hypothetical protein|nr:T9SS type A sorting domain-containing protein [Bacteroidia bacterium]
MLKSIRIFFISSLSILTSFSFSQSNLVPNPSFEDTVTCPQTYGETFKCKFWNTYRATPDYFNSCSTYTNDVSTPYNFSGYQIPRSGNAYMGVGTFVTKTQTPNYREYIGGMLTSTLIVGQKYFFSLNCVATKSTLGPSNCYSSKLGVTFSKTSYAGISPYPINNSAKVYSSAIISDTVNWNTVKGSFVADSAYKYVIIGNFFNDNLTDTLIFDGNPNCLGAYYFVDDVCLSTDSNFAYNYYPEGVTKMNSIDYNIKIYPNPINNIFTLEKPEQNDNYFITNVIGTVIKSGSCNNKKNIIDVSELENGIYFLALKEKRVKIIINH